MKKKKQLKQEFKSKKTGLQKIWCLEKKKYTNTGCFSASDRQTQVLEDPTPNISTKLTVWGQKRRDFRVDKKQNEQAHTGRREDEHNTREREKETGREELKKRKENVEK